MTPTDELIRLAAAGGAIAIDARERSTEDLIDIAAAAKGTRAKITIYNVDSHPTDELIRIAAAGGGAVAFEFRW